MARPFRLRLQDGADVAAKSTSLSARRGIKVDGVTTRLDPGVMTVVLRETDLNPITDTRLRPGRPVVFEGLSGATWKAAFTGTVGKARMTDLRTVTIDVNDAVSSLAADQALDALHLGQDTDHSFLYIDRNNVLQNVPDRSRKRLGTSTLYTLTDGTGDPVTNPVGYYALGYEYGTDEIVNDLTVTRTDGLTKTWADDDSVAEWSRSHDNVNVTSGTPDHHITKYLAGRTTPRGTITSVSLNATLNPAPALDVEVGDVIAVRRQSLVDARFEVTGIDHKITPRIHDPAGRGFRWLTTLDLRDVGILPLRWSDIPPGITWADLATLAPGKTWRDAATYRFPTP